MTVPETPSETPPSDTPVPDQPSETLERFLEQTDRVICVPGSIASHACDAMLVTSMYDFSPDEMEAITSRFPDLERRLETFKSNPAIQTEDGPSRLMSLDGPGGRILFARITDKQGAFQASLLRRALVKIGGGEIKSAKGVEKFPVGAVALNLSASPTVAIPRIGKSRDHFPIGPNMIELLANEAARVSLVPIRFALYLE